MADIAGVAIDGHRAARIDPAEQSGELAWRLEAAVGAQRARLVHPLGAGQMAWAVHRRSLAQTEKLRARPGVEQGDVALGEACRDIADLGAQFGLVMDGETGGSRGDRVDIAPPAGGKPPRPAAIQDRDLAVAENAQRPIGACGIAEVIGSSTTWVCAPTPRPPSIAAIRAVGGSAPTAPSGVLIRQPAVAKSAATAPGNGRRRALRCHADRAPAGPDCADA